MTEEERQRLSVLDYFEWKCAICGRKTTSVHHIKTKGAGGKDDVSNLLPLCQRCHDAVHSGMISRAQLGSILGEGRDETS